MTKARSSRAGLLSRAANPAVRNSAKGPNMADTPMIPQDNNARPSAWLGKAKSASGTASTAKGRNAITAACAAQARR